MTNQQIRDCQKEDKKFIEEEWIDDTESDMHDWEEDLPYGYAADGVRVRYCKECKVSLVFNLDNLKNVLLEWIPTVLCGELCDKCEEEKQYCDCSHVVTHHHHTGKIQSNTEMRGY